MIRKLIRQMLTAQIFSALSVSLCLLVDNMMIGRFLGEQAIAAQVLANPLLLFIGAMGTLLAAGVQVVCGKSLGAGSQEETNSGYSSAVTVSAVLSLLFVVVVLAFTPFLARMMGAGASGEFHNMTRDYMAGFSIGAPGSMGALVLIPFLQMAGQSNLLIVGVVSMTVADIGLDLLNVTVFHGGMFGMGLASSVSYYVAMAIVGVYFFSKRCVFRFSFRQVRMRKILELFREGIPAGFNMAASVIMGLLMNRILKSTGGKEALAAFAAIMTLGNAANCVTTGVGGVSLTVSGIFYHEEDSTGLRELIRQLSRYSLILGIGMAVFLNLLAPALIVLFIPNPGAAQRMGILGLRLFAIGIVPCALNNALKNSYLGTRRILLNEIISMLEGAVFPVVVGFVFSRFWGTTGAWLYFFVGETITLLFICLLVIVRTKRLPWQDGACLLLRKDFGVAPGDLLEMNIHSMQEVAEAAKRAEAFCGHYDIGAKIRNHVALCIEEMAGNTIQHGFARDRKQHSLSVRLLHKKDCLILRFRDDCGAFDPVSYIPEDPGEAIGIRLMQAFAEEANYTYALNLNNLNLRISAVKDD